MPRTTLDQVQVRSTNAHDEWATPDHLFKPLDLEFVFTFDVAASADNAKCRRFYSTTDNALVRPWRGVVWCSPPHGKGITVRWVEKAIKSSYEGAVVVLLVPARPGTTWFQELFQHAEEVRFVNQRSASGKASKPAPFPCAIVVLRQPPGRTPRSYERTYSLPAHRRELWSVVQPRPAS